MRRVLLAAALCALAGAAEAQQPGRCQIQFTSQGYGGFSSTPGGEINWVSGGVTLSCIGQSVTMSTDSAVRYPNGDVALVGRVRYRDTTVTIAANRATFRRAGETWEARGGVVVRNLETGSTVTGPAIDYLRAATGVRDSAEVYATGRPTVEYFDDDPVAEGEREPYIIVSDRLRARGKSLIWAGGRVTVDRSDLSARGDSMRLDTGVADDGTLVGSPVFRGLGADSFEVQGRRIDFELADRAIARVLARDSARIERGEWTLDSDTADVRVDDRIVQRVDAWGAVRRAVGTSARFLVRGDSVVLLTPAEVLTSLRAYGDAWLGGEVDSAVGERDWLSGDTVVATFAPDSTGEGGSRLTLLQATGAARSFQVDRPDGPASRPTLAYVRGDAITVRMRTAGEEEVERVEVQGEVRGVQLEPADDS